MTQVHHSVFCFRFSARNKDMYLWVYRTYNKDIWGVMVLSVLLLNFDFSFIKFVVCEVIYSNYSLLILCIYIAEGYYMIINLFVDILIIPGLSDFNAIFIPVLSEF